MNFSDFKFHPSLLEGLESMGYTKPTPIQEQTIPIIQENNDIIACAQTGTGKTAAYLLPILDKLSSNKADTFKINTIILAPTRELALQIDQQLEGFSYFTNVSSLPLYGGGDGAGFDQQKKALTKGADVIVATPGKLLSHLNLGYVDTSELKHLILDEADRMLDMGFYDDIMKIINFLPKKRQTLLFSATMPPKINSLAIKILIDPKQVNIAISKPAAGITQQAYMAFNSQKIHLIQHLLKETVFTSIIIFSGSKALVKEIEITLKKLKLAVKSIHSDLDQTERENVLRDFKSRRLQVLVATDILSRGIDIEAIDLVINYDVPGSPEDYVHRIGRTARASNKGLAITFINEKDQQRFYRIEKLIETKIPKLALPEFLGDGPKYEPEKRVHHFKKPIRK
ncbi:MAG: DEAD/DEAH box helicase [Bacteroidetes bacterium]|nr:DEAD/DEAH box helicase [Bacteroidota bacterium]HET6243124.1 DEAD/DEAH box helicase [Bacteroidia bacterium]